MRYLSEGTPGLEDVAKVAASLAHNVQHLRTEKMNRMEPSADRSLPEDVDPELWFEREDGHRLYLLGNPHTFPGRMYAYNATTGNRIMVSKEEIAIAPSATRYWVLGYIAGNEPGPPLGDDGFPIDDPRDPRYETWSRTTARFSETGYWWGWAWEYDEPRPPCTRCGAELLPSDFHDPPCAVCPDQTSDD